MELLSEFGVSVLSKLGEKLVNFALSTEDRATLESLRSSMSSLCAKASDIDEEIKKLELSGKKKRKREVGAWLEQVQKIENVFRALEYEIQTEGFLTHFFRGGEAAKLKARVDGLVEQSQLFGKPVIDACDLKGETLLTKVLVGEKFERTLEKILKFLLVDKVSSIGIYGMGGVGKTTLAKHLNNRLLEETQMCVVWLTISQEFDVSTLQDEIAKFVGLDLSSEKNVDKRASKLNRVLSQRKNIVFIFDDVWTKIDLGTLGDPLSIDGCKVLITTRSQSVCHQIGCKKVIKVKTLKKNEAWELFTKTLGQQVNLTPEVHEIAMSMVEVCDGLPLGIITIAGSMKGATNFHVWNDAWAELRESIMGQEDMKEQVFKVLKYSFDRLNRCAKNNNGYSRFQLCFLLCSMYPEDSKIDIEELIRKFILEECLDKRESRKALYSQGHAILEKLVNVCLLERVDHDKVTMHDLVRAMALQITEGKTKVIAGQCSLKEIPIGNEWTEELEKMSLMSNGITTIPDGVSPNCPKLLTLILQNNQLEFIPNTFFLQMPRLVILDLSWTQIKKLPNSLSDMECLKALLLTKCYSLEYVPHLGKLKQLRELDLTRTAIQEVPQGMEELINLNYLSLNVTRNLKKLPKGWLLNFPYLQCLYLPYHIEAPTEEIQELKHLDEFHGRVQDTIDCNRLNKSRPSLAYCIKVGLDKRYLYREFLGYNQLEFLEYDFNSREEKDIIVLAQGIQHLNLQRCKGLSNCLVKDLPRLNNPTSIQSLSIQLCEEIETLTKIDHFSERDAVPSTSTSTSPPPPHAFFSSLSVMTISFCKNMKKLGIVVSQLQNLKELQVEYCEMMEEIMEAKEGSSGGESYVSLPKLEFLHLVGLPRLKTICDARVVCTSIQRVTLKKCQALEKFPLVFGQPNYDSPPVALEEIWLRRNEKEWWERLELGHISYHSLLQPFLKFLDRGIDLQTTSQQ